MTTSTKFDVNVEAAFDTGVQEGKRQAYNFVIELLNNFNGNTEFIKRLLETELKLKDNEIKNLVITSSGGTSYTGK